MKIFKSIIKFFDVIGVMPIILIARDVNNISSTTQKPVSIYLAAYAVVYSWFIVMGFATTNYYFMPYLESRLGTLDLLTLFIVVTLIVSFSLWITALLFHKTEEGRYLGLQDIIPAILWLAYWLFAKPIQDSKANRLRGLTEFQHDMFLAVLGFTFAIFFATLIRGFMVEFWKESLAITILSAIAIVAVSLRFASSVNTYIVYRNNAF